jgi:beta-glucosidase
VPNSASKELLTNILRRDLEFDGSVVSDYGAVEQVYTNYQYAKSLKEAAGQCLNAGLDVDLESGEAFKAGLLQSIEEGAVLPATLDSAVTRQLVLKIRLGMLDPNSKLFSSKPIDFDPPTNRKRAYISACQSLVLLKNEGNLLPLQKSIHSIALVGPNAADVQSLLGDYTYQTISRNCSSFPTDPNCPKLVTILEGLQSKIGDEVKITHARGCDWVAPLFETSAEFQNAIVAANQSDVIVAVMGENGVLCGEGHDRADVRLPGQQEEFIRRLAETGKPIVLVICGGRPPILTDIAPFCRSIVMAWYSGEEGGNAMADLLTGAINPSGKLTVTLPRSNQQSPICYSRGYKADDMPLYPFGYGISYTTYGYSGLKQPATVKTSDALIPVTFTVENTGTREGTEIVQLYISSKTPLSTYPKMELVGFARVSLNSGRKSTVTCRISPQQLAHYDKNMRLMIEPGQYEVLVGASSTDIRLKGTVTLSGAGVLLPKRGAFFSETRISPQKKF